ncbi:MAG: hypothetical protein KJ057_02505 [Phycisphaerae bacterium]|nr:MAG: hypothetical protein F9K17_05940 [Phycisphaerae bacterium]MBE7456064.1 hypothetical protein [Planctomycetia bacterium]MCK6466275.1 hypothetical protein [Phycisphaerae bacterium]MCL4717322.1 hypothetical protein [Phycisphaerae bacterium]NUQ07872.1 hypothetical protein [Phycisphaerae bacterium]
MIHVMMFVVSASTGAASPLQDRVVTLSSSGVRSADALPGAGYLDDAELERRLQELVVKFPDACMLTSIGKSRGGRELYCLRLGRGADVDVRPALAIVAGFDADFPVSTETAVRVAERLLNPPADVAGNKLVDVHTVYVLPRMNPDGWATASAMPRREHRGTLRPVDDDRDGAADEDGPDDVNCDGVITLMRVVDPEATHLPDPAEPRLLKEADRAKGEKPVYKIYTEGVDDDTDGEYNEDGPGAVDLNRNFMHAYPEHEVGAGPYPVSEPESKALIDFFLAHPRIALTVVYGRHDHVVKTPESGRNDATGRVPLALHQDDAGHYEEIGKRYRDLTGIKEVPKEDADGAFSAWCYAQLGIPTFACRVWTRPESSSTGGDAKKPDDAERKEPAKNKPEDGAATPEPGGVTQTPPSETSSKAAGTPEPAVETSASAPGAQEQAPTPESPKLPNVEKSPKEKVEPADKEAAAWLTYSDSLGDHGGFVPWAPFEHPTLGGVEIGGFVPLFLTTPPVAELDGIADRQAAFVFDLGTRLPKPTVQPLKITPLSDRVFEIETAIVNDGYFPTAMAMGRQNRRVRPIVVTIELPLERILAGERVVRVWSVAGSGGREKLRWIVTGEAGEAVAITFTSERYVFDQAQATLPARGDRAP